MLRKRIEPLLFPIRNCTSLILKDEMRAADDHPLRPDGAGNAMGHEVFHLGVHLLVGEPAVPRGLYHGVGHGVREMLLQAGGQAQHLLFAVAAEGDDPRHHRAGIGQRAGLVKHDRIRLGDRLQILSPLDRHMISAGLAHGGEDRQGHRELQCAGEIHHQHREGARDVPGQQIRQPAPYKRIGHQLVRQVGSLVLRCGF